VAPADDHPKRAMILSMDGAAGDEDFVPGPEAVNH
jgi:hypothetical protein